MTVPPSDAHGPAGDTGQPDPSLVDHDVYPVCVQAPAGWWRIFPLAAGAGREYVAELVTTGPGTPTRPLRRIRQSSLWTLEEHLGWPLPRTCHTILGAATPESANRAVAGRPDRGHPRHLARSGHRHLAPTTPPPRGRADRYRPSRASLVLRADHPPATLGRLLHAEPAERVWTHGETRVEILTTRPAAPLLDADTQITYRVFHRGVLLFAGNDAHLPATRRPAPSRAVRVVVITIMTAAARRPLTDPQRAFLTAHGPALTHAARPVEHPYPPGTAVAVTDPEYAWYTTGTVLAHATGPDGHLAYQWRPDVADLPGHPWRDHPGWAAQSPADRVHATLDTPDTHSDAPAATPPILATGALVTAIDDPRFTVATVLRAFVSDSAPRYEIQPHNTAGPPLAVRAEDVAPLAGTAWPTVTDLLLARAAADLDLRPGEVLTALRDMAVTSDSPHGPRIHARVALPAVDLVLDPDGGPPPVDAPPAPRTPIPVASLTTADGIRHVHHPDHGHLAVPDALFTAAYQADHTALADILARRPWLPANPD
ncbi:hypothetical protein I6A84_16415, partial [Frankia sp. CNm7]